jgi:Fe-S-cluster-containing hydrogenase component 2
MRVHVIAIHAEAPAKPAIGDPCNGCGVCCLAEPCPLGVLASRRRQGACAALQWDAPQRRYRCGMAEGRSLWAALARRWIAAGRGCDSDAEFAAA